MLNDAPHVRAGVAQDALKNLDGFEEGLTATVRGVIPDESLSVIDKTRALGWIPVEHDRHIPTSVFSVLGDDRGSAYFEYLIAQVLEGPLLRASWRATVQLFGLSPASLIRATPLAWPAAFRNFGTPKAGPSGAQTTVFELTAVHPDVLALGAYPQALSGVFTGLASVCGCDGSCDPTIDKEARTMRFRLEWT